MIFLSASSPLVTSEFHFTSPGFCDSLSKTAYDYIAGSYHLPLSAIRKILNITMKTLRDSIRFKIIFPFIIMTACVIATMIFGIYRIQNNYLNKEIETKINGVKKLFTQLLAKESKFMIAQLEFIADDKKLIKAWRKRNREELYHLANQIYSKINKQFNVTHFYFVEPDRTCFLRVHSPERYGDIIPRYTMRKAAESSKITYGIELGVLGTFTLRVVYPWVDNGEFLGYLELGEEIEHLTPQLQDISDIDLIFTVYKSNLEKENWETGIRLFGKDDNWDSFESFVVIDKTVSTIPFDLKKIMQQSQIGSQNISDQDRLLRVKITPLIDAAGNNVGDKIALYDFTEQSEATKNTLKGLVLIALVVAITLFFFYYIYAGQIERQVNTYQNHLEELVTERTKELEQAFAEIKTLSGCLPMCASCKKIRDDKGYWQKVESYISAHSEAEFTHGICPKCAIKLYPELYGEDPEKIEHSA